MSILDFIIADKQIEVAQKKKIFPIPYLEASPLFDRQSNSLVECLIKSASGIIAEHKRRSPSKQNINSSLSVAEVASSYEKAGACGMSVLTDGKYFGGSLDDLNLARSVTSFPILRKEFIIDEYQIIEAKAHGADVVLLIAGVLSREQIKQLSTKAKELELEVLLEIHNLQELEKSIMPSLDIIGVNNRNLNTFRVSLATSKNLIHKIPDEFIKISESGLNTEADLARMANVGARCFLIGEALMRQENLEDATRSILSNPII